MHCKLQGRDRMSCPRCSHRSSLSFLPPFQEWFIPQLSRWIGIKTDLCKNCLIPRESTSSWHPAWLLLKLQVILGIIVTVCSFFLIHLMVDLDDGTAFFHWRYDRPNNDADEEVDADEVMVVNLCCSSLGPCTPRWPCSRTSSPWRFLRSITSAPILRQISRHLELGHRQPQQKQEKQQRKKP